MNSFEIKTDRPPNYFGDNFFWQFVNNFSALLFYKIYVFDFFNIWLI